MVMLYITNVYNRSNEELHMYWRWNEPPQTNQFFKAPTDNTGRTYSNGELILFQAKEDHAMQGFPVPWGQGDDELDIWVHGEKYEFRVHHEGWLTKDSLYISPPDQAAVACAELGLQSSEEVVLAQIFYNGEQVTWQFDRSRASGASGSVTVGPFTLR